MMERRTDMDVNRYTRINGFVLLMVIFSVLFILSSPVTVFAAKQQVFDNAELFGPEERAELEKQLASFREEWKMDLGILTVNDAAGKTTEQVADDFYDNQGMGIGQSASGALFVIDMDNREIYISTLGGMSDILTDERIESVLDGAYPYISEGDYKGCAAAAVDGIGSHMRAGVPAGQYDAVRTDYHPSLKWSEILFAFCAAAFVAILPCVSTVNRYKLKKERKQALDSVLSYRSNSAFLFQQKNDRFINKTVTERKIPKSTAETGQRSRSGSAKSGGSGSSAGRTTLHRSSSNRMHGGGGRKF